MKKQVFSSRRSRAARRPSIRYPKIIFCHYEICGSICQRTGWAETESGINCCSKEMGVLVPISSRDLDSAGSMNYRIMGGYNGDAVQVFFHMGKGCELEWPCLRTFTEGYMKYIMPGKCPPYVFALADEDAFSYCDESPCLECTFWCRRGFVVYGYVKGLGLVEMPLDQVSPYWQSGTKTKG